MYLDYSTRVSEAAVMRRITLIVLITLLATPTVHAQVTIEVSKITCDQYLGFTVADPRDINIWLSGYYHGQQGSTALEPQRLKEMANKLRTENRMPAQRKSERAGDAGHQKDSGISLVPRRDGS
jgi:acid stress chaperone HdeB